MVRKRIEKRPVTAGKSLVGETETAAPKTGRRGFRFVRLPSARGAAEQLRHTERWHWLAGGLSLVQGLVLLLLGDDGLFPVTTSFLARDPLQSAAQEQTVLSAASQRLFDLNLTLLLVAAFLLLALTHAYQAVRLAGKTPLSVISLERIRSLSWAGVSGIVMLVLGLLVGVRELWLFAALFALGAMATVSLGWLLPAVDGTTEHRLGWPGSLVAALCGAVAWSAIWFTLYASATYGTPPPTYVYWLVGSLFGLSVAFTVFAMVRRRRQSVGGRSTELIRIFAGLTFLTVLGWQVLAGALSP